MLAADVNRQWPNHSRQVAGSRIDQRLPGESNLCCRSRVGIYEQDNDSLVSDRCGMHDLPGVCGVSEDRRMLRYFADSSAGSAPEWRSFFRGTAAHNTIRVNQADQSQIAGPFMWLKKANAWIDDLS